MQVVIVEPLIYLFEQFSGGLQIDARGTDIYMTHIGGKSGQPGVDIVSLPVPGKQPVYSEGVPQIMDTRPSALIVRDVAFLQ
jgi:hypothetical protein